MNDYEARRAAKISRNQALLAELDIKSLVPQRRERENKTARRDHEQPRKRARLANHLPPSRTSARLAASTVKPIYLEEPSIKPITRPAKTVKQSRTTKSKPSDTGSTDTTESVTPAANFDELQSRWTSWTPTASEPTRSQSTSRHFIFDDQPDFTPNKSPEEIIREGAFGGSYYRPLFSKYLGATITGDYEADLPLSWLTDLDVARYVTSTVYDPDVNKFKVACGQSIEEWEANGWIAHDYDVRGWFQWYIRFFRGRRCADDTRQISRWKKCVGETGRWRRMLLKKYMQAGVRDVFDDGADEDAAEVSPVMHQTCHHWAYEIRQPDLDQAWSGI